MNPEDVTSPTMRAGSTVRFLGDHTDSSALLILLSSSCEVDYIHPVVNGSSQTECVSLAAATAWTWSLLQGEGEMSLAGAGLRCPGCSDDTTIANFSALLDLMGQSRQAGR